MGAFEFTANDPRSCNRTQEGSDPYQTHPLPRRGPESNAKQLVARQPGQISHKHMSMCAISAPSEIFLCRQSSPLLFENSQGQNVGFPRTKQGHNKPGINNVNAMLQGTACFIIFLPFNWLVLYFL